MSGPPTGEEFDELLEILNDGFSYGTSLYCGVRKLIDKRQAQSTKPGEVLYVSREMMDQLVGQKAPKFEFPDPMDYGLDRDRTTHPPDTVEPAPRTDLGNISDGQLIKHCQYWMRTARADLRVEHMRASVSNAKVFIDELERRLT